MPVSDPTLAVKTPGASPGHPVPGGSGDTSLISKVAQGPLGVLAAVILLFAVLVVVTPGVAAPNNLQVLARSFSIAALVGLAQMIVIGSGGGKLKEIATAARLDMERLFGSKVYLEVWVKVRGGWTQDAAALRRMGYG